MALMWCKQAAQNTYQNVKDASNDVTARESSVQTEFRIVTLHLFQDWHDDTNQHELADKIKLCVVDNVVPTNTK